MYYTTSFVFVNKKHEIFRDFIFIMYDNICMEGFSDRIKSLIKKNGITVKELGDISGVGYRTIESWLGAKQVIPKVDAASAVALALNTSVEYLVTGIDSRYDNLPSGKRAFQKIIDEEPEEKIVELLEGLTILRNFFRNKK